MTLIGKINNEKKPAEAGSEFLLRGMSYPSLRLGSQCVTFVVCI